MATQRSEAANPRRVQFLLLDQSWIDRSRLGWFRVVLVLPKGLCWQRLRQTRRDSRFEKPLLLLEIFARPGSGAFRPGLRT
jgi:hypothetical protein